MSSLRVLVLFALLGVALASSDASQIGFAGTWTDNGGFGKDLFMCTPTATTLYGSYSEFGVLVGYLSNFREAAGYWYDACIGKCCHGEFAFKLSTDGNSFTGSYTCSENPHKSFDWSETRNLSARTQTPNDYQCAALTPTRNSMAHKWVPKTGTTEWDICFDGSSSYYNSSYVYDDASGLPVLGYESGNVFQVGRIIQGYFDEEGRSGTSLTVRTNGNEAVSFFWVTNGRNVTVNGQNFDNPALHGRIIYKLDQSGEPTTLECFRNDFLSSAPQTVNAGVSVTCSKALLAMAAVIAALLLLL